MVKKILHSKLKIEENEPGVNSSVPGRVISSWFNSDTRRATLVKNPLGLWLRQTMHILNSTQYFSCISR
jgi:hypothetical protein